MTSTVLDHKARQQEALSRAHNCTGRANIATVYAACEARGYEDVRPGENVLTYEAWRAEGRQVRRGEKGIALTTYIPTKEVDEDDDGNEVVRTGSRPHTAYVFHVSQTDAR